MTPKRTTRAAIYAPATTPDKDQEAQISELAACARRKGWDVVEYREKPTSTNKRPVFDRMITEVRGYMGPSDELYAHESDVLVIPRAADLVLVPTLDCLADSLAELFETLTRLSRPGGISRSGIQLFEAVGAEPRLRTSRSFLEALAVLVKTDGRMKLRNVRAGIAEAKRRGVHFGRPLLPFPRDRARRLQKEGLSIRDIASRLNMPASTVARGLKRKRREAVKPLHNPGLIAQS